MASPTSGNLAFGPDWLFANLGGEAAAAPRRVPSRSKSSSGGAPPKGGGADAAGGRPRHVYTTPQILAKFVEGAPVPESLLQFSQIVRPGSVFPQAFTPLTETERADMALPINSATARTSGGRGAPRSLSGSEGGRGGRGSGGWGAGPDKEGDGEWTHVDRRSDSASGAGGSLKNKVEVGPDGQRRLVISGLGGRGRLGSSEDRESFRSFDGNRRQHGGTDPPGRSASGGSGRFSSSTSSSWRRGPPRPTDPAAPREEPRDERSYVSRNFDDKQFSSERGGRGNRRQEDAEAVPEWAMEPVGAKSGGDSSAGFGAFGADGTFFTSADDAGALGGLESLEPEPEKSENPGQMEESSLAGGSRFLASIRGDSDEVVPTTSASAQQRPAWAQALVSAEAPAPAAAPPSAETTADEWFYKDLANEIQGPFTTAEMSEWYGMEYFEPNLEIRKGTAGDFVALGKIVSISPAHRAAPFTTPVVGFNPPLSAAAAEAAEASQAAREHEKFMLEQQERRRQQHEQEVQRRQQEMEKQRREEQHRLEMLEQQRREEQQRLEETQRAEQQKRLEQQRMEQQRVEAEERQKHQDQLRHQAAQEEALRNQQSAVLQQQQQQLAMLPPQYQQAYVQMRTQFQQQQTLLQHQLMEVNQRMQEIFQARKQVQEAVQSGRLVIDEHRHSQIQQQEVVYNQYHMKRLEIYDQNKQLQQVFAARQQQFLEAARRGGPQVQPPPSGPPMAPEGGAHMHQGIPAGHPMEQLPSGPPGQPGLPEPPMQSAPVPEQQAPPAPVPEPAPGPMAGLQSQPEAPPALPSEAEPSVPETVAVETPPVETKQEPSAKASSSAKKAPPVQVDPPQQPPPSRTQTAAKGSKAWQAAKDADEAKAKAKLSEILKQEELRKQQEEDAAKKIQKAASNTAAPPAGSPWGAPKAVPAATKSLDQIQAEEAQRAAEEKAKMKAANVAQAPTSKKSPGTAVKSGPPVSFLEIQKAEEEAKKALVKRQKQLGIETGPSVWSAAAAKGASVKPSGFVAPTTTATVTTGGAWAKSAATSVAAKRVAQPPPSQQARPAAAKAPAKGPAKATAQPPAQSKPPQKPSGVDDTFWDYGSSGNKTSGGGSASGASDSGATLAKWCEAELNKLDSGLDAETFSQFILAQNDEEVEEYVLEHYGGGKRRKQAREFVQNFLDRRASASGKVSTTSGWHTAGGVSKSKGGSTSDDGFTDVAGKGGKKNKRGQKIDPALLTYGVASSGGANRGQLDSWGA